MDIFSHLAVQLLAECSRIRFTEIRAKCGFGIVNGHTGQKTPFLPTWNFLCVQLKAAFCLSNSTSFSCTV